MLYYESDKAFELWAAHSRLESTNQRDKGITLRLQTQYDPGFLKHYR
jgi:hypothetical protein